MNRFLFYASARLFGEACLELYIYRITPQGQEQVYLLPRPADDPFYPLQLHMPGVRKLPTETDGDHLRRVFAETPFDVPAWVEYMVSTTVHTPRGTVYSDLRRVAVLYDPRQADFYDVDNLPDNAIEYHRDLIMIVRHGAEAVRG